MPRAEAGTPKAIANRMKAKGLQKLKFYCQACERQMRDENGFKCHIMSESHQRQMLLVAANPGRYVSNFSAEFKRDFISLLSRRHGTKRVLANRVYQEYISDRNHTHMNATHWNTLSGFCMQMSKEGIFRVDETERGLYISWIDNSPKALARQAAIQKMDRAKKDDEEREQQLLQEQIEKANKIAEERGITEQEVTELKRDGEQPIKLNLNLKPTEPTSEAAATEAEAKAPIATKMILGGLKKKTSLSALAKKSSSSSSSSTNSMKFGNMMKRKAVDTETPDAKKIKSA